MKQETLNEVLRGQLYFANLDPVIGSEQGGRRPVLVVQNDVGNRYSTTVIVAPITSQVKKTYQPTHVRIPSCQGLPRHSMVMLEQLRAVDKSRLEDCLGSLESGVMDYINRAIGVSVGIDGPGADRESEQRDRRGSQPEEMVLCLCPVCASQFFNSTEHIIRRVDPLKREKDTCTYCEVRQGYDYRVIRRKKRLGDDRA